jgi:hypothetical protein
MLNRLLKYVEKAVVESNQLMSGLDLFLNKILPHSAASAGACPCAYCGPNCKVQAEQYYWSGPFLACRCVDTTTPCQPC